jgi:hypothetical protein
MSAISAKMDRLYETLLTSLYEKQDIRRARSIARQLAKILSRFHLEPVSIFVEECRSLVSEAKGDLVDAIKHRENEIGLIRHLLRIPQGTEREAFIRSQYDYDDLRDRMNILATLYHDNGDLATAVGTLEKSRRLCRDHGLEFDGEDVLREYKQERSGKMIGAIQ